MSCEQIFSAELKAHGLRLTPQRELVLNALHQAGQAPTAEELFARVREQAPAVELSTVYRTLELLESLGLVAVIEGGEKQRRYHLSRHDAPHVHLVCRACGRVSGLALERVEPLLAALEAEQGFRADPASIVLAGQCAECAAANPA